MAKHLKKLIAREFLILISLVIICLIGFIVLYSYNTYCENKIKKYHQEASALRIKSDSLSESHDRKLRNQAWFYKKTSYRTNAYKHLTPSELWVKVNKVVSNGKFKVTYSKFNKSELKYYSTIGFNSYDEFATFVFNNTLNQIDLANKTDSRVLKNEIENLNAESVKAKKNKIDIITSTKFIIIASVLILFVMRYLIYGIKWSIKTLQEN